MDLALLGWNSFFEEAFAGWREKGLLPARVVMEDKHAYVLVGERGDFSAAVTGKLLHQRGCNADLPKVGDWVAVALMEKEGKGVIQAVLPRRTRIARKMPGREVEEQILAANIDTAFVVQALDQSFNRRRLERFLVMVHEGGATPVVAACAKTGRGLKQLRELVRPTETVVFIGPSGVGKSSLINRLYGEEIQATIEVREQDAKGRHATTWRELIQLPWGGLVIDTPGMREFHTWGADDGIREAFPDVEEMAVRCHFRDCTHTAEKRCAVQEAVACGVLARERYESYLKLQRELDYLAEERKKHTYLARQLEAKVAQRTFPPRRQGQRADSEEGF